MQMIAHGLVVTAGLILLGSSLTTKSDGCETQPNNITSGHRFIWCIGECDIQCDGFDGRPHPNCASQDDTGTYEYCASFDGENCEEPVCCHIIQYYISNPFPEPATWGLVTVKGACQEAEGFPPGEICYLAVDQATLQAYADCVEL